MAKTVALSIYEMRRFDLHGLILYSMFNDWVSG